MLSLDDFMKLGEQEREERYKELSDDDRARVRMAMDPGARDVMCNHCTHRLHGPRCEAFPDEIPKGLILRGEHDTPFPGDNGIRFEKVKD